MHLVTNPVGRTQLGHHRRDGRVLAMADLGVEVVLDLEIEPAEIPGQQNTHLLTDDEGARAQRDAVDGEQG